MNDTREQGSPCPERDGSWAMRHELAKLNDEARAAPPDTNNETDR